MILRLLIACGFVGSAIIFAEVARENKWVSGERARKIIHILVGLWGAWLPLWLNWSGIQILSIMLFVGVCIARELKLIKSMHAIPRVTIGEYIFPLVMLALAIFFKRPVIFAAAMLEMGLADGLAAVIGTRYGKKTRFKVLGHTKSKHGTATFFVVSLIIIFSTIAFMNPGLVFTNALSVGVTLLLSSVFSIILAAAELTGIHGLDNISVPLLTAIGLTLLQ